MKLITSTILCVAMCAPTAPAGAQQAVPQQDARSASTIRGAMERAALEVQPVDVTRGVKRPPVKDRSRKQGTGGGNTAMIIGLVSALAGLAGTYYVIKATNDSANHSQQP